MFDLSSKIINIEKQNHIIKKNISLDTNLDCFIHIDSESKNFTEAFLNKIVDHIIDKISIKNTYWDFSIALENINAFIKAWNIDNTEKQTANVIIGIQHNNNFIFSSIGHASAYWINRNQELISLTEHSSKKDRFSDISNWELKTGEIILISSTNILSYLSQSDIIDGIDKNNDINHFTENIYQILTTENLNENIIYSAFKYTNTEENEIFENKYIKIIQEYFLKVLDTKIMKRFIIFLLKLKNYIIKQSKWVKNILFIFIITLCIIFLYNSLSSIISVTTNNQEKEVNIEKLEQAKNLIRQASDNVANTNAFEKFISEAEIIIESVKSEKIFLSDIDIMQNNVNILKKQFNKIETFEDDIDKQIYAGNFENFVKIIKNKLKPYILEKKSITWAINWWATPKKYVNTQLDKDEFFIDATVIWDNIYISTNKSKIVRFAKTGHFSFVDVQWQDRWWEHKNINSYNGNLYITDKNIAQIYKHWSSWKNFTKATPYLKADDINAIWKILSIAIDWGFYILKSDLMVQKFFSWPKYEMVNIVMNNLPKNYVIEDKTTKIELKARADLNFVYILLNNKIFVFQPNSRNYRDVTSLTYVWQIDWFEQKIKDFYVNHDWELWVINNKWIYDLSFEISDNKLILR